jgi:hypothetical protein
MLGKISNIIWICTQILTVIHYVLLKNKYSLGVSTAPYIKASSYLWKFVCHKSAVTNTRVIPW